MLRLCILAFLVALVACGDGTFTMRVEGIDSSKHCDKIRDRKERQQCYVNYSDLVGSVANGNVNMSQSEE